VSELLITIVVILVAGVAGQLVAKWLRVPSVVFYLAIGLLLGEAGVGLVTLETFGDGGGALSTVVGFAVAVIVFDGAFALRAERVREASKTSLRFITVGAVVMFAGTAAAVWALTNSSVELALLIGALLVATGPTVITPIVEVVSLREHVSAALETEGIVNDVTAAIAAVVIFETILLQRQGAAVTVLAVVERLGVGVVTGLVVAGLVYYLMRGDFLPQGRPQAARFLILLAGITAYGVADVLVTEAGVAAAATAGVVLGNLELPHRETAEEFLKDMTLLLLAFVFISLAALVDVGAVVALGLGGVALVAVVMLVLRPLVALLSTVGVERFTRPERLFLAAAGPRGIIPASVATLFALDLAATGAETAAQTLLGAVFVVIFVTDAIEAGLARQIGELLGVTPMPTIIIGGGRVGRSLATQLESRDEFVTIVDDDPEQCEKSREQGFRVVEGDGTVNTVLEEAGIEDAKAVAAATKSDDINLLVCQTVLTKYDIEDVYARVNDPENVTTFESLGVVAVDDPKATAYALDNEIERPALAHWMNDLGDGHEIVQLEMTTESLAGKSIREFKNDIPSGVIIAEIGSGENAHVPDANEVIEYGDQITFLGDADAVDRATKRFHPHE
jgi:NhaP-type Na+/H+ or K+/H+ antiporter